MKKIILIIVAFASLNTHAFSYDHLGKAVFHGALGSAFLAASAYSAGETLFDCGHGYYELKQFYLDYLHELDALKHTQIMSRAEKRFWAFNQMLSRVPRVFLARNYRWNFYRFYGNFSLQTA
jgi:hypothetical protein